MNAKFRRRVERSIVRAVVKAALAAGYLVAVDNGGDEYELMPCDNIRTILRAMFATCHERLWMYDSKNGMKRTGFVWLVYGNDNGENVIADYTINLEHLMAGVSAVANKYQ